MLLKPQLLGVSGQAANPARQHPPVEYMYRSSHPMLQFPVTTLEYSDTQSYSADMPRL